MRKSENAWSIAILIACLPLIMATSGCPNALMEAANKTSDDAYLFDAEMHANKNEWTEAIASVSKMTAAGRAKRETKSALGSYYAGRCGLRLLDFAQSVKNGVPATRLFPLFSHAMAGATASQFADCKTAEATLVSIGATAADRTPDENVLLAFVEFAKIGSALTSSGADANGDGTLDVGFDACSTISNADVEELGTGVTIAIASLQASGSTAATAVTDAIGNLCLAIEALPGMTGFCSKTSTSDFNTAPLHAALHALIKSNELGFNSCNGPIGQDQAGTGNDCICPVTP